MSPNLIREVRRHSKGGSVLAGLRTRSIASALLASVLLAPTLAPAAASAEEPCFEPANPAYADESCRIERLRHRPFVVVAVVDSGINPYHVDFRLPDDDDAAGIHPSEYIEGFPASTPLLDLALDKPTLAAARAADAEEWEALDPTKMAWMAGTNIVGHVGALYGPVPEGEATRHGTGTSSVAAGLVNGPRWNDILLVSVHSRAHADGLAWAARQPWIDVISNSWGETTQINEEGEPGPADAAKASKEAVQNGKVVCFATLNYAHPQVYFSSQGPSWIVSVGGASKVTRGEYRLTGWPNDVLGFATLPVASWDSLNGTFVATGTSVSAPYVCGQIAKTLSQARAALGDFVQGPHGGGLVVGTPRPGYLADGVVDRLELEDAIQSTAVPAQPAPPSADDLNSIPASPVAPYVRGGYGIVDATSAAQALKVILGEASRPPRPDEDVWVQTTDAARDAVWGPLTD